MQLDTLKELLRIYSRLPAGIIIFKEGALYFINDHLRDILTLGDLPPEKCIATICGILEIETGSKPLGTFLKSHPFFIYKEKYIQIAHNALDHYDLFLFARLEAPILEYLGVQTDTVSITADHDFSEDTDHSEAHEQLLEYFDTHRKCVATGHVLYKGIPLIAKNIILQPFKKSLVIKAENKQMASAVAGTPWILITGDGMVLQGEARHADSDKRLVFLQHLRTVEYGFHQRQNIRYTLKEPATLVLELDNRSLKLHVPELSDCALRAITSDSLASENLSRPELTLNGTLTLEEHTIPLSCRFFKEIGRHHGEIAYVFRFSCDPHDLHTLRDSLNNRQLRLIKELKEFTRTLP